jgi:EAP30/Vps36 family
MAVDLTDDLVSMGIAAPVTKETAGRKYHKALAQQVTSWPGAFTHVCCIHAAGGLLDHSWQPEQRVLNSPTAVQLADFLRVPLERAGGMMTLPDVYCLFNRARGTELVSPDDLLQVLLLRRTVEAYTGSQTLWQGGGTPGAAGAR